MNSKILLVAILLVSSIVLLPNLVFSKGNSSEHSANFVKKYDITKTCATNQDTDNHPLNPMTYLTYFSCGHVSQLENGTTLRQFTMIIHEDHKVPVTMGNLDTKTQPIMYNAWTFNSSIPAPTIRMTEGDHISIKVVNLKQNKLPHSFHMHSIHAGSVDGTMFNNQSGSITPGHSFTYNFVAAPTGLWPFHCHQMPISLHIVKGLYGQMIIDPPKPRPAMHEMNMIINGYDLTISPETELPRLPTAQEANVMMSGNDTRAENASESLPQERDNQVYSANGIAFYYDVHPIPIALNEPYRLYLTNMLDFDFSNTFHLHGQVFKVYPAGTENPEASRSEDTTTPIMTHDIISMAQGDRAILEWQYDKPGLYMIHSHFESQSGRGWEGLLSVHPTTLNQPIAISTSTSPKSHQEVEVVHTNPDTPATSIRPPLTPPT
jgi:Multicopper oxidase